METDELLKIFKEHRNVTNDKIRNSKGERFKYDYTIFPLADTNAFFKHCYALRRYIDDLEVGDLLEDVDGSYIQHYYLNGLELRVYYDTEIGAVYDKSDFDIKLYGFGD